MITTKALMYLLLRSPTGRLNGSPATRNACHLCFKGYATRSSVAHSNTFRSQPRIQNQNYGPFTSVSTNSHRLNRSWFSSQTGLSAAKSSAEDDSSSPSAPSLSTLALSIGEALEEVVKKHIVQRNQMPISQDEPTTFSDTSSQKFIIILSVSGGCDSVALLHATMELQNSLKLLPNQSTSNWELECHVVHFHHRQRDVESDLDCQLVQELAEQEYGIPFVLKDWNQELLEKDEGGNLKFSQDRARQWRRRRLLEYTRFLLESEAVESRGDLPIGVILTAHHRGDSEESLLLKLLRGVHILNLSGMEAITTLDEGEANIDDIETSNIYVLRPWLKQRKADLQDYLLSNCKTWREDASNASPKYLRNRIRNELIPLLEELSPNVHKRMQNLEQQSFELQQDLEPRILAHLEQCEIVVDGNQQAERQYIWEADDSDQVDGTSPLVQSQALFQWMQQEIVRRYRHEQSSKDGNPNPSVSYEMLRRVLEQLRNHPNQLDWTLDLGGKYSLQRKGRRLKIINMKYEQEVSTNPNMESERPWTWSMAPKDESSGGSGECALALAIPAEMITRDLQFLETTVEEYALLPNTSLRFRPPWKPTGSPIKLRQFLRGQQVPLHERHNTPVLYMITTSDDKIKSSEVKIVAVQVNGSWMVHSDYNQESVKPNSGMMTLHVEQPAP